MQPGEELAEPAVALAELAAAPAELLEGVRAAAVPGEVAVEGVAGVVAADPIIIRPEIKPEPQRARNKVSPCSFLIGSVSSTREQPTLLALA